jgi:hypothetical protein
MLAFVVLALGAGVLYVGAGSLGKVAGTIGATLAGFVETVTTAPTPTPAPVTVSDAPTIRQPAEPYTNQERVDLVVIVPATLVGDDDHRIRIYLALEDQSAAAIAEVPIGPTQQTILPVDLEKGTNDFSVTIVGPGGESESSALVRYILDTSKPKVTFTSPKNNATVNRTAVELKGKTQARSTLIARNTSNGTSISVIAEADGTFVLSLPIGAGSNRIVVTATDPAGNVGQAEISVRRGNGKLSASLAASVYQIKRGQLPEPVRLTVTVNDPDGKALAGATVTFTLSMPGIPTVTKEATTSAKGTASFETTIPKGATTGEGIATVLVTTTEFGTTQDRTVVTITK